MSCKLACQLADRIAAIANEAGGIASLVATNCDIKRPMPALIIHGTADPIVLYDGVPGIYSAEATVRFFTELNDCSQSDTTLLPDLNPSDGCTIEKICYSNIGAECRVIFYKVINGGHLWPGAAYNIPTAGNTNRDINANVEMWNFFKQYKLSFPQHDVKPWSSPLCSVPILATNITPLAVVKNFGLSEEFDILVTCEIDSSGSVVYSDSQIIDSLKSFEKDTVVFKNWRSCDPFKYTVCYCTRLASDENISNDTLTVALTVSNLMDDFESGLWKWSSQADWGVTANFSYSGTHSLTTNPAGAYQNNSDSWVAFRSSFDLSKLESAHISFWTRYFIEKDHDFGFVEVSTDSGQSWHQLGEAYTGFQSNWIEHSCSLTSYCGAGCSDVRIRFRFVSDSKTTFVGWMIDDISIYPTEAAVSHRNNIRLPDHFVLSNNYPNPFNSQTIIAYQLLRATDVKVIVYNLRGQKIKTLIDQPHQAGAYQITWDGLDSQGSPVTSGVYFYALITDDNVWARKMTLLR
jgi:hypothetical protein